MEASQIQGRVPKRLGEVALAAICTEAGGATRQPLRRLPDVLCMVGLTRGAKVV